MAELFFFFVEKRKKEMGRGRGCETAVSFFHHLPEHRPQIASPSEHSSYLPAEVAAVRVPVGVPAEFVVHLHGGGGVFVSRFLFYAVDVVDVFDRRKRFERERARGERKKRFDAKNYSRSLHEKINQQFFSSPLLLKPKMASHLASLGKVGPTIGERVSSWKKRAGVDQQKEDRNVRLFGRRRCPPTIAPSKKKTRPRFLSFSPPAPPLSHAARLFPSPPPLPPLTSLQKTLHLKNSQRPSSASPGSASSPSPGSSTTARASRSRRSPPTGSCRRRSGSGRWSARAPQAPLWSATRSGGARRKRNERERGRERERERCCRSLRVSSSFALFFLGDPCREPTRVSFFLLFHFFLSLGFFFGAI